MVSKISNPTNHVSKARLHVPDTKLPKQSWTQFKQHAPLYSVLAPLIRGYICDLKRQLRVFPSNKKNNSPVSTGAGATRPAHSPQVSREDSTQTPNWFDRPPLFYFFFLDKVPEKGCSVDLQDITKHLSSLSHLFLVS